MSVFKAHVQDGRLVLDEPTDLPEGEVVYLQSLDATELADGSMSDEEREDLFQALEEAIETVRPPGEDEPENEDTPVDTSFVAEHDESPVTTRV
jgi:hypothetical protein